MKKREANRAVSNRQGYAEGVRKFAGESGLLYSMGFVIATGWLHDHRRLALVSFMAGHGDKGLWGSRWSVALAGAFFMWTFT